MPFGKGRRKLLWVLGVTLIGLVTIWFSVPLWLPWILEPVARHAGAHFSSYTRIGYTRFSLHNFVFADKSVVLKAEEVEGTVPTVWLWRLAKSKAAEAQPFLVVNDWTCDLLPSTNSAASPTYSKVQDLASTLRLLQHWVPRASLARGAVHSDTLVFSIPSATWKQGRLDAAIKLPAQLLGETVTASLIPARPFQLSIDDRASSVESTFVLVTNRTGLEVQNSTTWRSNRLELLAGFDRAGALPITGAVHVVNFRVPADMLKLPGYEDVTGSLSAVWDKGQFGLDIAASGHPASTQTNLPPIEVELHSRGDTNSATIEQLSVRSPFLQARLSNEISVLFSPPYVQGQANLELNADLSQQHFVSVTGTLNGSAAVSRGTDRFPVALVHLAGANLGFEGLTAKSLDVSAHVGWPLSEIDQVALQFDDGSSGAVSGKVDLENRSTTDGHLQFRGPLVRRWLPAEYTYRELSVEGTFSGPIEKPTHAGRLELADVNTPFLKPISLSCQWNGVADNIQQFDLRLTGPNASLNAAGSVIADTNQIDMRLSSLSLLTNQSSVLQLSAPLTVNFSKATGPSGWRLVTSPIQWVGRGGEVALQTAVQWPNEGRVQMSLRHFSPDLLSTFAKTNLPQINIENLGLSADWTNGPMRFAADAIGSGTPRSAVPGHTPSASNGSKQDLNAGERILAVPLTFELKLHGDEHGIVISNLVVNSSTSDVVSVRGFLPVTILPATTNLLSFDSKQRLNVEATVRPQAFFWQDLSDMSGVKLQDPSLDLSLSGTWSAPSGKILFGAKAIQLSQTNTSQLSLEDLRLDLSLNGESVRLTEGQVLVQGQHVRVEGELPLGRAWWTAVTAKKLPDWTKAKARVRIQEAKLAAFEPLFPKVLAPQGELNLDLQLLPDLNFNGALILRNARTRPLGTVAPIRNINVTLRFRDRLLDLENASANLSSAPLKLTGTIDLSGTNWLSGELPPFHLTMYGTNVPLARAPEYIIRSDLDLQVTKTNGAPALVLGTAHLRDSFYLSDLSALIPRGVETPSERPPYFSIDNPTLADWRLAVTVEGVRWLRLRTSLFNGQVSANLHLQGTFKDPIVLGGVTVNSGLVRFPFANFQVQQGLVSLTSQDPYHPQLLLRAVSKQFGYDLHMEVSRSVDSPIIQFTSTPALSSEQILLMITTGQMPQGAFTLTPQQRAQTVALFLGKDLLSKMGFGDQSQERLTISSGEQISEQGRPTYNVEYKVTDRWSLVGEYDRFGDLNAGLKWRVYSK